MECDSGSKWNLLKPELAIDTSAGNDDHSAITAVIRYRASFLLDDSSLTIIFGLGEDISLRTVLGLPMMLLFHASLDLINGTLSCPAINVEFQLYTQ